MQNIRFAGQIALIFTSFALSACGGGGGGDESSSTSGSSSSQSSSSSVSQDANNPPEFISVESAEIKENSTQTGYTAAARDADEDALTYSIAGGPDKELFNIDSDSGELRFVDPPDYERPADEDADNAYIVELEVDDDNGGRAALRVTVNVTDVEQRAVFEIDYPTPDAEVGGEEQITVAGTVAGMEGDVVVRDFSDVAFVDINGRLAMQSENDATRWTAQVPVDQPFDTLEVSMEWASGGPGSVSQAVTNRALLSSPRSAVYDGEGHLLVVDEELDALVEVNVNSGARNVVSDAYQGDGPVFDQPEAIAVSIDDGVAYVADSDISGIFEVDLSNGNRTILSGADEGEGVEFSSPMAVVLDGDSNRLLVMDRGSFFSPAALFGVSLETGDRAVLSGVDHGTGDNFDAPSSIALDPSQNRVLVAESFNGAIVQVDLSNSGNRTVFSGNGVGEGNDFDTPRAVVVDGNRALVADDTRDGGTMWAVSLSSGDRQAVTDIGTGAASETPRALALDSANDQVWVVDTDLSTISSVNLGSGAGSVLADSRVNSGKAFVTPVSVALDIAKSRILVVDQALDALIAVDLTSGNRHVISGLGIGEGPTLSLPQSVALDEINDRALVVDNWDGEEALIAVDLKTGNRKEISGPNMGEGAEQLTTQGFESPQSVAVDTSGKRAWVTDPGIGYVVEVDLATGDRSVFDVYRDTFSRGRREYFFSSPRSIVLDSDSNRLIVTDGGVHEWLVTIDVSTGVGGTMIGSDPGYSRPRAVSLGRADNSALVVDADLGRLVSVNFDSPDSSVVSSPSMGAGPEFVDPESVAVDANRHRAFVADPSLGSVLVVDLNTGDRAVVSK